MSDRDTGEMEEQLVPLPTPHPTSENRSGGRPQTMPLDCLTSLSSLHITIDMRNRSIKVESPFVFRVSAVCQYECFRFPHD
ncbi:hypothetical protein M5X11_25595 [Paenibacillus alginolyticus]|uniref:hypothetical protein n=1 Tax=Paenibacillus alginolyticus TaxID=59839 RepID=UPI000FDA6E1F|nr:hypothetical protein [Paenibacillus alginolyticus]MCY9668258.1 hypothetical protein [Paenibacillus alginolyticus]